MELGNRDYTLILDKSGSMSTKDMAHGKSRWSAAQEGTLALAAKIEELDPDGITLYTFAGNFKRYDNVTASKVADVFKENEPNGSTDLAKVLGDAFDNYFTRKKKGDAKAGGELFLVVTDGEPDDQAAVAKTIVEASKKVDSAEEIHVEFLQIGHDTGATKFLQYLDDNLTAHGAKFDIVDTTTSEDAENMTFADLLTKAITD